MEMEGMKRIQEVRAFLAKVSNDVMSRMKRISVYLFFTLVLVLCGCSTFNYEWRQAARQPIPTSDIIGRWEGRWISSANGHQDILRCLITRVDERNYEAKFHAAYKKWITFH